MEDASLFPELMWQHLQTRPLVLAFRGPQGGEPRAARSPGQQQSRQRPQLTGLDSGNMGEEGVPSPWEPALPATAPSGLSAALGHLQDHRSGTWPAPKHFHCPGKDRQRAGVAPGMPGAPTPETLLISLSAGSPV